jgi:DNA-directed RNA polymerase specialized sigma24 family protein
VSQRPRFEDLVARYQTMVARICASYERDRDLCQDLSQEVWFANWRALPAYRAEASLKTFVARIAQFRAISHATQHARRPAGEPLSVALIDSESAARWPSSRCTRWRWLSITSMHAGGCVVLPGCAHS